MRKSLIISIALIIVILALFYLSISFSKTSRRAKTPETMQGSSQSQKNLKDAPAISTYAVDLEVPWAIAFLPDGKMLVTERPGRVRIIDTSGNVSSLAQISVRNIGEGGLLGIALDPDFATNNNVYLYYTYRSEGNNTLNRVVRYRFENLPAGRQGGKLIEEKIIVDRIPGAPNHNGGRIKFGPDGFLYITTGDAQEPSLSQNKDSLAGKILRVNRDGNTALDNPFGTRIYSYGHRNPQGITWDNKGRLWSMEHGSSATDELNLIEHGKNYGWPEIRGEQTRTGIVSPVIQSGSQTWAPGGIISFNDSIFFAGLRGTALFEYKVNEQELVEHFKNELGRLRDVVLGPDNMLYVATSNRDGRGNPRFHDDKILRINPQKLSDL